MRWSRARATRPYDGIGDYMKLGYVPIDKEGEAASKTVEYAFDDWTIARMAADHGPRRHRAPLRQARRQLAQRLRPEDRLPARARLRRRLPRTVRSERQRLRHRLHRGQRLAVLVVRAAGRRRPDRARTAAMRSSSRRIDAVFDAKVDPKLFAHMEDITGLIGWYAHGNEPSHHVAYLYDYAGQPWRTQERLKQIMDSQYARTRRRPRRQRRPRPDVGLVRVHRARLLSGRAGQQRVRDRPPVPRPRASQPAERQALHASSPSISTTRIPTSAASRWTANRSSAASSAMRKSWPAANCTSRCNRFPIRHGRRRKVR